jgi:CRISPR/Cas system CSM-associated protein Csm3 (group 7 of RAMP superfamily)
MITLNQLNINQSEIINLTATIETALCVGAGGSSGSLADKPIIRNGEGKLLIPASQLKGRLRHECEKIARGVGWEVCMSPKAETMCPQRAGLNNNKFHLEVYQVTQDHRYHCLICQIFGNPSLHSRLLFDDLICTEKPENLPSEVIRPGTTINRRRQTSDDQKLYFLETSVMNAGLEFTGHIHILPLIKSQINTDLIKALLLSALKHINALGGSKSAGLGWVNWEIETSAINEKVWEILLPEVTNAEN